MKFLKVSAPILLFAVLATGVYLAVHEPQKANAQYLPQAPQVGVICASSGNVSAGSAVATLAASTTGKTTFITGFTVTSTGSTSATIVTVAITGTSSTNSLSYTYLSVAGVSTANATLNIVLPHPIPASANNTAIVVTVPTLGSGNTNCCVTAYGFQQ